MKNLGRIISSLIIATLVISVIVQSSLLKKEKAYSAAMAAEYESDIDSLSASVTAARKELNDANVSLTKYKAEIELLKTDLETYEETVSALNTELASKSAALTAKESASLSIKDAKVPLAKESANSAPGETAKKETAKAQEPIITASEYATLMLTKINEYRAANGVAPLSFNNVCLDVADKRAAECGSLFSHSRPNGEKYYSLYDEGGYDIISVGENCSRSCGYEDDDANTVIDGIMDGYKNSPGHNENMLNPKWKYVGFGFFRAEDGTIYGTQEFSSTNIK
ncbi:Uncharacterized conserved protein YkwD, contains CAP (CSP/antigen 5/PR1) domain [Lachnospiraceae bacterium YSD2013]|nr:Uncharacterized conserved protein YkwD, contains CAP (CSP/antigen 5/PR1) domain [Lachnospiraceae bacterium YSD2013]